MKRLRRLVSDLRHDLGYGLRSLRRSPGFTSLVVVSLGLGIGANTAIFSLINAVFLRPLAVHEPRSLVLFTEEHREGSHGGFARGRLPLISSSLYQRLLEDNQTQPLFEGLTAQGSNASPATVRGDGGIDDGVAERAEGRVVSASYFGVLGVPAYRGRTFSPDDDTAPGANPVLVLSHGYWQRRFGGNPATIGATLRINGGIYTVIGVTPPEFTGIKVERATDFWVPLSMDLPLRGKTTVSPEERDRGWLHVIGRLKPGVSLAAATTRVNLVLQQYLAEPALQAAHPSLAESPERRRAVRIELNSAATGVSQLRRHFREPLSVLMVGVGLLLGIVCLNVAHLLLARALQRKREMTIRIALGASGGRITRQLLTEGLLLAGLGGVAALLVQAWVGRGLLVVVEDIGIPISLDVGTDRRVLLFGAALSLTTAALVGLVPAWRAASADLQTGLRVDARNLTADRSRRLGSQLLLASQVAFSIVLLVGAGLLAGSLGRLRATDKGFDEQNVLLVELSRSPLLTGISLNEGLLLNDRLLERVREIPGVQGASLSRFALLSGSASTGDVDVGPVKRAAREVRLDTVTPGYFKTVGMTLLRGRDLSEADHANAPAVVVVNETLARQALGGVDLALGRHLRWGGGPGTDRQMQVVGVVRDARTERVQMAPRPMVFVPVNQQPDGLGNLEVRAVGDPSRLAQRIRQAVRETHPGIPVTGVRTMRSQTDRALMLPRLLATLASGFGLTALFLVSMGLYGVISHWAGQRTQEIGVRVALGATNASVLWLVLRQGLVLVLGGVAVGLPAALGAAHMLRSLLHGITPMDPVTLIAAALLLLAVATLATYLPARRASRIDPVTAMRAE